MDDHRAGGDDALARSGDADPAAQQPAADEDHGIDPLLELRAALDGVDDLPLRARAQVFERTHAVVVEELRALELG